MLLIPDDTWAVITIWQESRGEDYIGKIGVGEVIYNRMSKKYMSDGTAAGTCLRAYQFSGWNAADANRIPSLKLDDTDAMVQECMRAWVAATTGSDYTHGALFYYNPALVIPPWAKLYTETAVIGKHRFMVPK